MENILEQKPQGKLKKWMIAGIVSSLLFVVCYIFAAVYTYQMALQMYGAALIFEDYAGILLTMNGLFAVAALVFFIGMFSSKKRNFFLKFMLWTLMLLNFYFIMPRLGSLASLFLNYSGLQLLFYLGMLVPPVLIAILLVSFILQKDSEIKNATNNIAWISIIVNAALFVIQLVYLGLQGAFADLFGAIYNLSGAVLIAQIVCLSAVILLATKTDGIAVKKERSKEAVLDDLVEKIANEASKDMEDEVERVAPDED